MSIKQLLGKKIKKIRHQRGLTQEQLSEKVDISLRALSGIERGINFLTAETLDKIIDELIEKIKLLKNSPEKLEEVYKVVKAMTSEF